MTRALITALCAVVIACGPSRPALLTVALPDLSRSDAGVQAQANDAFERLNAKIKDRATTDAELAAAYGELAMLLQAAEFPDAAEPAYRNAQTLAAADLRWPYYLGHLYKAKGDLEKAAESWRRVLTLQPDNFATLIWLGRLLVDLGRAADAAPLFSRALELMPRSVAALAGLARVDLERRDYSSAAARLESALAIDPQAESLHAPLATAYRSMGQADKASPHLRQWRNTDILFPDPLQRELDLLLESGLSYELRGVRALEAKDWNAAAGFFRRGLALARPGTPLHRSLAHKLGTALFMGGDGQGAAQQFEAVVKAAPPDGIDESTAKAHYSLGVLMAEQGRNRAALDHLSAAVRYQPSYLEARLGLADALRREGRVKEALQQYEEALVINPQNPVGRLGYAVALAGLRRFREAVDWLDDARQRYPDRPEFTHALARVLATAPDAAIRDGQRARELITQVFEKDRSTSVGETMAMTLAEVGDFDRASAIQRGVRDAAQKARLQEAVARMESNLREYEQRRPCRTPWRNSEPLYLPAPASQR